jgi:hypothetical protein
MFLRRCDVTEPVSALELLWLQTLVGLPVQLRGQLAQLP